MQHFLKALLLSHSALLPFTGIAQANRTMYSGPKPGYEINRFLNRHFKYRKGTSLLKDRGRIVVEISVNDDGEVENVTLVKGIDSETNKQIIKVLSDMRKWKPGIRDGRYAVTGYNLPIDFSFIPPDILTLTTSNDSLEGVFREVMPAPGYDINKFLSKNLKYPEADVKAKIGGRVLVHFTVDTSGSIVNVAVLNSVEAKIDAEAIRIVSLMPPWQPGLQNDKPVQVLYTLPITFHPH